MAFDDDGRHLAKKLDEVGKCPPLKKNHEEFGKYSVISENNLVGDEESKETAFDDDGRHPAKKFGEVGKYPPPKNNYEEFGKNSGISEKNLVGDKESKKWTTKERMTTTKITRASAITKKTIGLTPPRKTTTTTMITPASAMAKKTIGLTPPRKSIQKMKSSTNQTIHKHKQKKQSTTSTPWIILQHCIWLLKRPSEN
jgi:hypothetical protein